jgi:hypothetical protein
MSDINVDSKVLPRLTIGLKATDQRLQMIQGQNDLE